MCTLSWLKSPSGYNVLFNRDERVTRARGVPPNRTERSGVAILAPTDADFGGTWIGVNELGLCCGLLNRYEDGPTATPAGQVSRGLLVLSVLDCATAGEVSSRLAGADLLVYQPFTLAAFDLDGAVRLFDWTGVALAQSGPAGSGLLRTSSGADQLAAERSRAQVFQQQLGDRPPRLNRLIEVHGSHLPERGPLSVCMHRDEARTQSLTVVEVTGGEVALRYADGPPCTTPLTAPITLPRRRA